MFDMFIADSSRYVPLDEVSVVHLHAAYRAETEADLADDTEYVFDDSEPESCEEDEYARMAIAFGIPDREVVEQIEPPPASVLVNFDYVDSLVDWYDDWYDLDCEDKVATDDRVSVPADLGYFYDYDLFDGYVDFDIDDDFDQFDAAVPRRRDRIEHRDMRRVNAQTPVVCLHGLKAEVVRVREGFVDAAYSYYHSRDAGRWIVRESADPMRVEHRRRSRSWKSCSKARKPWAKHL